MKKKGAFIFNIIFIVLLITEIINNKFNIINFEKFSRFFNDGVIISQSFITIMVTMLSISYAICFIAIQIFRNRYPLDTIKKIISNEVFWISINFISNLIYGSIFIVFKTDFVLLKMLYIIHIIFCIYLFSCMYKDYKIFNSKEILNNLKIDVISTFTSNSLNIEMIQNCLQDLRRFSDESFARNEVAIISFVNQIYEELIINYIENRNKLIINREDEDAIDIHTVEKMLFSEIIYQLSTSHNYNYENCTREITYKILTILYKCIECDILDDYKNFTTIIDKLFNREMINKGSQLCIKIVILYKDLYKFIIKKSKNNEWLKVMREMFQIYSTLLNLLTNEDVLKMLLQCHINILEFAIEEKRFDVYKDIFDDIFIFFDRLILGNDKNIIKHIEYFIILHSKILIDLKDENLIKQFLEKLYDIGNLFIENNNEELCIQILFIYNDTKKQIGNKEIRTIIDNYKFDFAKKSIYNNEELAVTLVPEYFSMNESKISVEDVEDIAKKYWELFYVTLLQGNAKVLLQLLNQINTLINQLEANDTKQYATFFQLYKDLLRFSIDMKSLKMFQIVLNKISEEIKFLDKKISKEIFITCLEMYKEAGVKCIEDKQVDFCVSITSEIVDFTEDLFIVKNKKEFHIKIIDILFLLGINAVENNIEEMIRNISNHLGWIGKEAIENNDGEVLKLVIIKAAQLMNICSDYQVGNKTTIFIGTLFIILGGLVCSKNNHNLCMKSVINNMKNIKGKDLLDISRRIRAYESNEWDELMDKKAAECMNKFYDCVSKHVILKNEKAV